MDVEAFLVISCGFDFGQGIFKPTSNCGIRDCNYQTNFPGDKEFSTLFLYTSGYGYVLLY